MRLLMITSGYLPYTFSENLCNGKLVYAMHKKGWHVDVISKVDEGPTYSTKWTEPWLPLKENNIVVRYDRGGNLKRIYDTLKSSIKMGVFPENGIRWARRAYETAVSLCEKHHYDAILTRSPSDTSHIVGLRLKKKTGIHWIANWNDPANPIWPEPYKHHYSNYEQKQKMLFTSMCLESADINTFPSQFLLEYFTEYFPFLSQQRNVVIPHIALTENIFPRVKEIHKSNTFRMCHSGNLSHERNPELTFKAMRELINEGYSRIQFSIMGCINDYTKDLIKKYSLQNHVNCIGSFTYMDAIKKMQEFDCLVLLEAKLKKGIFFASKFTDYAQIGKPILAISPTTGFAANIIAKFGGGISVDNEDYQSIKQGIKTLYNIWLSGSLQKQYSSSFLYQHVSAPRILDIYNNIL